MTIIRRFLFQFLVVAILSLLGWFITPNPLFSLDEPTFENLIDFETSLKDLDILAKTGQTQKVNKNKLVLLTGLVHDVSPHTSRANLLIAQIKTEDLISPESFILKLLSAKTALSQAILENFSPDTKTLLKNYTGDKNYTGLLKSVLNDLNTLLGQQGLLKVQYLSGLSLSKKLRDLLTLKASEKEEAPYLNRLIMEEAFPGEFRPFQVQLELLRGEWLGVEEVKSYRAFIQFAGPESFKVFSRMRIKEACSLMIPVNTEVLIAALPLKQIQLSSGEKVFLLKGLYVRALQ